MLSILRSPSLCFFLAAFVGQALAAATKGAEIGKVFNVNKNAVEMTGAQILQFKPGTRILIETPAGLMQATLKELFHTKAKAIVSTFQAGKITAGNKVYELKIEPETAEQKEIRKAKATNDLYKSLDGALGVRETDALYEKFLKQGADINAADGREPPVVYAAMNRRPVAVKLLVKYGADINARGFRSQTALNYAAKNPELVKLLVERGADVNHVPDVGWTPLMTLSADYLASSPAASQGTQVKGNLDIATLILAQDADVNLVDKEEGNTALMLAASVANARFVELLLAQKADPSIKDLKGKTARQRAEEAAKNENYSANAAEFAAIIELLRKAEAK